MVLEKYALTGKIGIVTGAGSGIGKGIALGFAEAGAHVVVAEMDAAAAEATATQVRDLGRRALAVPTNVLVGEQIASLVSATTKEFGRIDILVNNVGGNIRSNLLELSEESWDWIIDVNLKSAFLCSQAVGKVMIAQKKGVIINLASMSAFCGTPIQAIAYGAAKAGIVNFTRRLALEWASYSIRVNAIAPGPTLTPLLKRGIDADPEYFAEFLKGIPRGRWGDPSDIAAVAVYLASDAADWVTGSTLVVDGGYTAH